MILGSIDEGDQSGAKLAPACDALGITSRTIARCVREEIGQMADTAPKPSPKTNGVIGNVSNDSMWPRALVFATSLPSRESLRLQTKGCTSVRSRQCTECFVTTGNRSIGEGAQGKGQGPFFDMSTGTLRYRT